VQWLCNVVQPINGRTVATRDKVTVDVYVWREPAREVPTNKIVQPGIAAIPTNSGRHLLALFEERMECYPLLSG
jgi:hypothetical protein